MTVLQFRKNGTAPAPYLPDPRNGEVWACESFDCRYVGDVEIQTSQGFDVIHMAANGDSFGCFSNHRSMAEAEAVALREAKRLNAVFVPSSQGGQC